MNLPAPRPGWAPRRRTRAHGRPGHARPQRRASTNLATSPAGGQRASPGTRSLSDPQSRVADLSRAVTAHGERCEDQRHVSLRLDPRDRQSDERRPDSRLWRCSRSGSRHHARGLAHRATRGCRWGRITRASRWTNGESSASRSALTPLGTAATGKPSRTVIGAAPVARAMSGPPDVVRLGRSGRIVFPYLTRLDWLRR